MNVPILGQQQTPADLPVQLSMVMPHPDGKRLISAALPLPTAMLSPIPTPAGQEALNQFMAHAQQAMLQLAGTYAQELAKKTAAES